MAIDARWYVVHTYSGYENKVAGNLEKIVENRKMQDAILDIKVPTETVTNEKGKEVERKLFPGYVLVKVAVSPDKDNRPVMSDDTWVVIRNTRGVTGFVGPEGKAMPLTEEEVYRLGVEKKTVEVSYNVGDTVDIVNEMFEGFQGVVDEIDTENNIVRVRISALFGKETIAELELDEVELAED
ncbi:MAG: transcription termination/antitermination factor NusG [Clostridia bacterium]|nr:transcription termination/antitermination factor NusG [Clostridia bacterium]MBR4765548.1 transcription termination/antitermination factor NusG [Clostridia bacterium]MBR6005033.1 transcription termination/antitermination factor NusG [Clostridia bacterium]